MPCHLLIGKNGLDRGLLRESAYFYRQYLQKSKDML